ncbi:MAG: hypothetical protein ACYC0B_06310 [Gemmatimonadaceae bacterium]
MTISGLPAPTHDPRPPRTGDSAAGGARERSSSVAASALQSPAASATLPAARTHQAGGPVPLEAPAGTDPALWSVLTSEERAYFARAASSGPLTYSKVMSHLNAPVAATLPRGGRLDARV